MTTANRRNLLGSPSFSTEGRALWAMLSSMTATEEEYRQKGGEENQFLVFRWISASTGTKCIKPEEQWLCTMMHKGWARNFKEGCWWVGRYQWEHDQEGRPHLQPASERPQHSYSLWLRTSRPKAAEQGQQGPGTHISCYSPGREASYPSQANLWVLLFTNLTKNITKLTNLLYSYLSSNLDTEELCGKFLFGQEHNLCLRQPCASEHIMWYDFFSV